MSRIGILAFIGLTFLCSSIEAEPVEGRIIFENDTVDVMFDLWFSSLGRKLNIEKLQYKVQFIDSTGSEKTLSPDDAREIQFSYKDENIRMLSRKNNLFSGRIFKKSENIFLQLKIDGKLKLFYHYPLNTNPQGSSNSTKEYVLQKEDGELLKPITLNFKKTMVNYFSSCPALAAKIENKEFRKKEMVDIVQFYNANCVQ